MKLMTLIAGLLVSMPLFAAEPLCADKVVPSNSASLKVTDLVRLHGSALDVAERLLGKEKIKAVDPEVLGFEKIPGLTRNVARVVAFKGRINHFNGVSRDEVLYVSANVLGLEKDVEAAILTLTSPLMLNSLVCSYSSVR